MRILAHAHVHVFVCICLLIYISSVHSVLVFDLEIIDTVQMDAKLAEFSLKGFNVRFDVNYKK